jgi:regulator of protease activity HflC (stomatin/prohibitin superfamily)
MKGKILGYSVATILILGAMTALDGFVIIDPGESGAVVRLGAVQTDSYMTEGLHFKLPFIETVDRINVQIKKFDAPNMEASSKDIQIVRTSCTVNYRINAKKAPAVRQEIGIDPEVHEVTALQPALHETIKAVTARYDASELISQRAQVSQEMKDLFQKKLNNLVQGAFSVSEFAITNFQFSKTFNDAIEAKVKATERAIQAENEVRQAKAEADSRIAKAHGEAESVRIRAAGEADAISLRATAFRKNPEILKLDIVTRWDGKLPQVLSGDDSTEIMLVGPMLHGNQSPTHSPAGNKGK